MAAHRILLAIGVEPFAVFVTFVRGDTHHGAGLSVEADGLQEMNRTEHVGGEGFDRDLVGKADKRLGGEMEDDLRRKVRDQGGESGPVGKVVATIPCNPASETELIVKYFVRLWIEGISGYLRTERKQPLTEPGSFEACVACHENAFSRVCCTKAGNGFHQIFQGAV